MKRQVRARRNRSAFSGCSSSCFSPPPWRRDAGRKSVKQREISKTATTYLRALADGDIAKACLQLTRHARGERCEQALKRRPSRFDADALRRAADGSMDLEVNGNRATPSWSEPQPAHFVLVMVGAEWRIDSGYTLG